MEEARECAGFTKLTFFGDGLRRSLAHHKEEDGQRERLPSPSAAPGLHGGHFAILLCCFYMLVRVHMPTVAKRILFLLEPFPISEHGVDFSPPAFPLLYLALASPLSRKGLLLPPPARPEGVSACNLPLPLLISASSPSSETG